MKDNVIFCASLLDAFTSVGMTYPERGMVAGKLVRFSANGKPTDTAGWCKLYPDGAGAAFGCNREGTSHIWQLRDANAPAPSLTERKEAKAKADEQRKQADIERAAQYAQAAGNALLIYSKTVDIDPQHTYITLKQITPYHARQNNDGSIVLPVFASDGTLQCLQTIRPDTSKKFLYQGKMKGGRLFIGEPANGSPLVLVEGWATGCSIHEATNETVVIGYSGSNLAMVAADLRLHYPDSLLRVAGDLDEHGKGLEYAQSAAAAGSPAVVVMPVFSDGSESGDFNDLHQAEGLEAVRLQLLAELDLTSREIAPFMQPLLYSCDARDGTANTRPLTELGNAQRLYDVAGDRLKYVHDAQSWIIWNGSSWAWNGGDGVRSIAAKLPNQIYSEGVGFASDAEHFAKWSRKSQEQRTIIASVSMLSDFADIRLPLANVDADHFIIGFNNSTQIINLRNGSIRAAIPLDYITKSLGAQTIGDATKAARWLQFLDQVFNGDQGLIDWMQRFCGYLLTGSTQEQIFLFCFGHGANGKSVFIEVLKHIIGDYSRAIASETLSESKRAAGGATPDLAALIGARLVICSETEDNTALAESLVKSLVSGDSMAVRQLYAAPVQFTPNFKLVMAGNHKPIVRGNDNGIWRRVRLVPFNRTFAPDERDPLLLTKLRAETPHILAWMVQGCIDWQRVGLSVTPATIRQATDAYQVDQDLTGTWLSECTTVDKFGETSTTDLYANYKLWSIDNGLRPASAVSLGRRLGERGYSVRQSHGKRIWCGLSLTDLRHEDDVKSYANRKGGY
ncbi:P4 family phage/plasmid primase-like protein [Undibacterium sp. GrIS 1.8]|uniref:phage/plasmid primase, P4 family n=1 Tax=Undibacterium sp. GrIS 1.8 TaxID=3143934 RepID=UPI0033982404